jgi:hypothetical protein
VTHLTERTYALLLQGSLPPEDSRALARHLEGPCAVCEELLASLPSADAADALVEEALGALVPAGGRGLSGNDLEFARIERALRERAKPPRPAPRRAAPAAIAAAVLAAGLAGLLLPRAGSERPAWDGDKGTAIRAVPLRLRFLVLTPGGAAPALDKGISGQAVPPGASLQFEIEAGRAAQAALVRVPARGAPELFWSERVPAGRTGVTVEGRPAAYPLAALAGPQRFVLVASDAGLDPRRVAAAAAALAPPARVSPELSPLEGLSFDVVEVEVR